MICAIMPCAFWGVGRFIDRKKNHIEAHHTETNELSPVVFLKTLPDATDGGKIYNTASSCHSCIHTFINNSLSEQEVVSDD